MILHYFISIVLTAWIDFQFIFMVFISRIKKKTGVCDFCSIRRLTVFPLHISHSFFVGDALLIYEINDPLCAEHITNKVKMLFDTKAPKNVFSACPSLLLKLHFSVLLWVTGV